MINLFQFAANDQSLSYLTTIFGSMNGIISNPSGGASAGSNAITLFGTMFKTFNTVILSVGALIVIYVTVVGVVKTAHEGEMMGKGWNSIWVPLRMVLGIAALVPTGSGYSAIQIVMMWVIVQGIGAADTVWNTVLGYVNLVGSPYGQVTIPSVGVTNAFNDLFKGLVCAATASQSNADPSKTSGGGYYCNIKPGGVCSSSLPSFSPTAANNRYSLGPYGSCGTLSYCNENDVCKSQGSLQCAACKGQKAALASVIPVLTTIAQKFAEIDYNYRDFYYTSGTATENKSNWSFVYDYCNGHTPPISKSQCCVPSTYATLLHLPQTCSAPSSGNFPNPNNNKDPQGPSDATVKTLYWTYGIQPLVGGNVDFIKTSVNYYTNALTSVVTTYIQSQGQNNSFSGQLEDAAKLGWIFAGSYYYAIANMNNSNLKDAIPSLSVAVVPPGQSEMSRYRNNFGAAGVLETAAQGSNTAFASTPQYSEIGGSMDSTMTSIVQAFTNSTTSGASGVNPLSALQITGAALLMTVTVLFPALLAITFSIGIAGYFDGFVLGTGADNPVGPTAALVYFLFVPMFFGLMAILLVLGGTLAVYVPLIPYIIFTFGAIGWLIMVIEAMVAGPLVALGILAPHGEHELLGKSAPALMHLFDVFLRPSLMIFGLIAAMLLATVVVTMINYAFWTTVLGGIFGHTPGTVSSGGATAAGAAAIAVNPLELIIFLAAYIALLVAALNKCFQAISIVPAGVMRYIGGHGAAHGGEEQAVGAAKESVSSATSGAKGAVEGGRTLGARAGKVAGTKRQEAAKKAGGAKISETKEGKKEPPEQT